MAGSRVAGEEPQGWDLRAGSCQWIRGGRNGARLLSGSKPAVEGPGSVVLPPACLQLMGKTPAFPGRGAAAVSSPWRSPEDRLQCHTAEFPGRWDTSLVVQCGT